MFVCPYDGDGRLPPEGELGAFGDWVEMHDHFYRLQSKVLTDLPVPEEWGKSHQSTLV